MSDNLLRHETSPYLLQHKDNPVHWRPWGRTALEEARALNRPILLSIGYAACHWCHVMAHESFEDQDTADVMNALFVNIKVDREERPDIDHLNMTALQALGQHGGWPLTMFLTPKGEPIWGGTYFPKTPHYGQPAFVDVLRSVAKTFAEEPQRIEQNRAALVKHLSQAPVSRETPDPGILDIAADRFLSMMDQTHGGIKGAPKFPQATVTRLLLHAYYRTGRQDYLREVVRTFRFLCQGGIYDHLGGGLARYSVDARWLVPHFEKMLYDNAQFVDQLTTLHLQTGERLFRIRIDETIAFLLNHMRAPDGGFFASYDADSEGREGAYYVWDKSAIEEILDPEDAALFCATYDITADGNFEGANIPNRLGSLDLLDQETESRLAAIRATLLDRRSKRIPPGLDDKILTDWNGLAIAALAHAGAKLDRTDWVDAAEAAFDFVVSQADAGGRLPHNVCQSIPVYPALSSDYAFMITAALRLYAATRSDRFLTAAQNFTTTLNTHHWDPDSGTFYLSADDASDVVVRSRFIGDAAVPSTEGTMAGNLVRLWLLTGNDDYRQQADRLLKLIGPASESNLFAAISLLTAFDLMINPIQVVVLRRPDQTDHPLIRRIRSHPNPTIVYFESESTEGLPASHPASGKAMQRDHPTIYICRGQTCSLPVTDANRLSELLD